jgi:hypothetical protein
VSGTHFQLSLFRSSVYINILHIFCRLSDFICSLFLTGIPSNINSRKHSSTLSAMLRTETINIPADYFSFIGGTVHCVSIFSGRDSYCYKDRVPFWTAFIVHYLIFSLYNLLQGSATCGSRVTCGSRNLFMWPVTRGNEKVADPWLTGFPNFSSFCLTVKVVHYHITYPYIRTVNWIIRRQIKQFILVPRRKQWPHSSVQSVR